MDGHRHDRKWPQPVMWTPALCRSGTTTADAPLELGLCAAHPQSAPLP